MFHLAAYNLALGVGTDIDVPALTDDILTIQNTHFVLSTQMQLMGGLAYSPLLDRIKLASPSMRQLAAPYMRPIQQGAAGVSNPNMFLFDNNPFVLNPYEEIQLLATSAIAASTERFVAGLFLSQGKTPVPMGGWTYLRFTSSVAAVANVWTSVTLTWADTLPAGLYSMCLSEHNSATAQFHRWIISNQQPRPGYPSFVNSFSRHPYAISKGQFGQMGVFRSNDQPRLQVLCTSADATHVGYLAVQRVGNL
jgi:hypothetical protein